MSSSLFIGRWQPPHTGHIKLIESVLKTGKSVVIAIRDTAIDKQNPYSTAERWELLNQAFKDYLPQIKIITIPDINEVCYGRNVGYGIRQINLAPEIEKVSATKIRAQQTPIHPIYWITGQSGSGKTTFAHNLQKHLGGIILDGDEMRASISTKEGFSQQDRHSHNLRVARLASTLSRQGPVIIAVIAPFQKTRDKIETIIHPTWIYIKRRLKKDKNKPYEPPKHPHITINTDKLSPEESIKSVLCKIKEM